MEGTSRFITWRNALEWVYHVQVLWEEVVLSSNDPVVLAAGFEELAGDIFSFVDADLYKYDITPYLDQLLATTDGNSEDASDAGFSILVMFVNATFKFFKISASTKDAKAAKEAASASGIENPSMDLESAFRVYDLVFVYFFVAAGLTLVFMAILMVLSKKKKVLGDWLGVGLRAAMGTGIALIALLSVSFDTKQIFLNSPWMLPCVMLGLLIVVVAEGVLGWVLPAKRGQEHGSVETEG